MPPTPPGYTCGMMKTQKSSQKISLEVARMTELLKERKAEAASTVGHTVLEAAQADPVFSKALLKVAAKLPQKMKHDIVFFWEGIKAEPQEPKSATSPTPAAPAKPAVQPAAAAAQPDRAQSAAQR